ncbi:MAG: glutamate 5-kinase [Coriobacteriaceae bacterium]|nr:glutamate 5-kinase [Coriobacteriaceae bacterium]
MKRLVVKIGSSTLTTAEGRIDHGYLSALAKQVAEVRERGWQVVIVSSGAIACGLERLGMSGKRPGDMPTLQAAASVGQGLFSSAWGDAFDACGLTTSTVLLTRRDTADRTAYLHARDTLNRLLELGVVPIVNENDTVSVEQIRFGDNDTLGALVACLIGADLAIILSDVEGLYDANPSKDPAAKLIERVERIDQSIISVAGDAGTSMGSGGMVTKVKAARVLGVAGIPLVVCSGRREGAIVDAVAGRSVGTLFTAEGKMHEITPRKLWIALGDSARGAIVVDDGARKALEKNGSSLLVVGVAAVEGDFAEGDIVDIKDRAGYLFARGRVSASRDEAELALGRTREELSRNRLLAEMADKALVHRDELVIFS